MYRFSLSREKLITMAFFEEGYDVHTNRDIVIPSVLERKSELLLFLGFCALCVCAIIPEMRVLVLPFALATSFALCALLGKLWVYVMERPWFSMEWILRHCISHCALMVGGVVLHPLSISL